MRVPQPSLAFAFERYRHGQDFEMEKMIFDTNANPAATATPRWKPDASASLPTRVSVRVPQPSLAFAFERCRYGQDFEWKR